MLLWGCPPLLLSGFIVFLMSLNRVFISGGEKRTDCLNTLTQYTFVLVTSEQLYEKGN